MDPEPAMTNSPFVHALPRMWTVVYVTVTALLGIAWLTAYGYAKYHDPWLTPRHIHYLVPLRHITPIVAQLSALFAVVGIVVVLLGTFMRVSLTFCVCVGVLIVYAVFAPAFSV